jgi:hypothetical protein
MIVRLLSRLIFVAALFSLVIENSRSGIDAKILGNLGGLGGSVTKKSALSEKSLFLSEISRIRRVNKVLKIRGGEAISKKKVTAIYIILNLSDI